MVASHKMFSMSRPLVLALALIVATSAPALAQATGGKDVPTGQRGFSEVGGRIQGSPRDHWLNWVFKDMGNGYGAAMVAPVPGATDWQNFGIALTDLPAKTLIKGPSPVFVSEFSSYTLHVSWAASDSDSVAIRVLAVGKMSPSSGDGFDFFFDSRPDTVGVNGWLVCSPVQRAYYSGDVLVNNKGIVSFGVGGGLSSNQVCFPIVDSRGNAPRFEYLNVWVQNLTNTTIDDITVSVWLKRD